MPKGSAQKAEGKNGQKKPRRGLALFALFLLAFTTLAGGFYFIALYPALETERRQGPGVSEPGATATPPEEGLSPEQKAGQNQARNKPLVAIVIDDMGYRLNTGKALLALSLPLSFSFLPATPFSAELQQEALARGREILLHLPLEPLDPRHDPGQGALRTGMSREAMQTVLNENLQAVPGAIGINNHMGSRFTADPRAMRTLLSLLRERDLFFLDSVTAPESVAHELAGELGIKTARRAVFLDNDQDPQKIREQLDLLLNLAEKHGQAIGIAHPHPATVAALLRHQAQLQEKAEVVGISRLVH